MTRLLLHSGSVLDVQSGEVRTADVVLADDRIVDIGIGLDGDEAIDCARRAARLLDLADDRGEIAVGKRADLVLLDGIGLDCSSLEDRIRRVIHNGSEV